MLNFVKKYIFPIFFDKIFCHVRKNHYLCIVKIKQVINMALIGTIQFSELMTWGCWKKKEYVKDIPNADQINTSYQKIKKQLMNMTETIKRNLVGTIINYGESGYDNSYFIDMNFELNEDIYCERIEAKDCKDVYIHPRGSFYLLSIHELDIDSQIKIMNKVNDIVSKLEKKTRTNFKF